MFEGGMEAVRSRVSNNDEEAIEKGFWGFPAKRLVEVEAVLGSGDLSATLRFGALLTTTTSEEAEGATGFLEAAVRMAAPGKTHFFLIRQHS